MESVKYGQHLATGPSSSERFGHQYEIHLKCQFSSLSGFTDVRIIGGCSDTADREKLPADVWKNRKNPEILKNGIGATKRTGG